MTTADVALDVLGPTAARFDGVSVAMGAPRLRGLLGTLVLWRDRPVPAGRIIDVLWHGAPPPGAANTLQGYVAALRRLLEPERRPRTPSSLLRHDAGCYRIAADRVEVDADRFEAVVRRARDHVQRLPDPMRPPVLVDDAAGRVEALQAELAAALRLWRGEAYADLGDVPVAQAERRRLEQLRTDARVAEAVLDLSLGRSASAADTLEHLVGQHPLHEQLWGLWAVALARIGRQAHALEALKTLRGTLADELGIDPGRAVSDLQADLLRQDPTVLGLGRARTRTRADGVAPASGPALAVQPRGDVDAVRALREAVEGTGRFVVVVHDEHDDEQRARLQPCGHAGCCHAAPVVLVVVADDPGQRVGAARDRLVIHPAQWSPVRDDRTDLLRSPGA